MADDENRVAIGADIVLQPDHAFQIEIVGRLVQQQHVRFGKQRRSQRHTHPPAAGKCRAGSFCAVSLKPRPARMGPRAPARYGRRYRQAASGCRQCGADLSPFRLRPAGLPARRRLPARLRSGFPPRPALPAPRCRCGHSRHLAGTGLGRYLPRISLSKVVLPVPLRPTKPTVCRRVGPPRLGRSTGVRRRGMSGH